MLESRLSSYQICTPPNRRQAKCLYIITSMLKHGELDCPTVFQFFFNHQKFLLIQGQPLFSRPRIVEADPHIIELVICYPLLFRWSGLGCVEQDT